MATFGQRLYELRELNKDTQENLAKKLSVSVQTVRRWEHDKNSPTVNQLKAICEIYKVSPNYFFDEEKRADTNPPEPAVKKENGGVKRKEEKSEYVPYASILAIGTLLASLLACILLI